MSLLALTPDAVAEIVSILDGSGYDRLDIKTDAFRLRIQRQDSDEGDGWTQEWALAEKDAPVLADTTAAVEELPDGMAMIAAPLPGTFYRAPQPGAPPFVDIGDSITQDTVVGIIETMKLMNPVHAGCTGVVEAIPVGNGAMVDRGTALVRVRVG